MNKYQNFDEDGDYKWNKNETRNYLTSLNIRKKNLWIFMKMVHGFITSPEAYVLAGSIPNNMLEKFTNDEEAFLYYN